jgi:hypothetical protein
VYENGGDFSTDVATTTYSPYTAYVGLKSAKTKPLRIVRNRYHCTVPFATVDQFGKLLQLLI